MYFIGWELCLSNEVCTWQQSLGRAVMQWWEVLRGFSLWDRHTCHILLPQLSSLLHLSYKLLQWHLQIFRICHFHGWLCRIWCVPWLEKGTGWWVHTYLSFDWRTWSIYQNQCELETLHFSRLIWIFKSIIWVVFTWNSHRNVHLSSLPRYLLFIGFLSTHFVKEP